MVITLSQDSEIAAGDVHSISQLPVILLELLITFLWRQKLSQGLKNFIDTLMSFSGNLMPFAVYSHDSHRSFCSKFMYKSCKMIDEVIVFTSIILHTRLFLNHWVRLKLITVLSCWRLMSKYSKESLFSNFMLLPQTFLNHIACWDMGLFT